MGKYFQVYLMGFQEQLTYRINFILTMVFSFIPVVVQIYLWKSIFNSMTGNNWNGYTYTSVITYFILANIITKLTDTLGFEFKMTEDIRTGNIAQFFVRPVNHLAFCFSHLSSMKTVFFLTTLIPNLVLIWFLRDYFTFDLSGINMFLFPLFLVISVTINFLISYLIALAAFWFSEVSSFFVAKMVFLLFMTGAMVPLDLLPGSWFEIVRFLPFKYVVFVPINLFLGRMQTDQIFTELLLASGWILLLSIFIKMCWRKAAKQFSAVGG